MQILLLAEQSELVDRHCRSALAAAEHIRSVKSPTARTRAFQSVLSQATAIACPARGDLLLALAQALDSVSAAGKGMCLAELRQLSADMPRPFRKVFLQKLLMQLLSNRESGDEGASGEAPLADPRQFKQRYGEIKNRRESISRLLCQEMTGDALSRLGQLLKKTDFSVGDRGTVETVIMEIERLSPRDQKQVVDLFAPAGLSCADLLGGLMQSGYMEDIAGLARKSNLSLPALYLGVLTEDRAAMQKLMLVLGRVSLPASIHLCLVEKLGEIRRSASPMPTLAMAGRAVLMEIISLSNMPESCQYRLLHALSAVDVEAVHAGLTGGEPDDAQDYWAYAHEVVATVVDIGTCYESGRESGADDDLGSYALRAADLIRDASTEAFVDQGKCLWDAKRLRMLILETDDLKKLKGAVFNILGSRLAFEEKLALLKCETEPVGASTELYVREARYHAAVVEYKKGHDGLMDSGLAFNVVVEDQKKYDAAYKTLTKNLGTVALGSIRLAAQQAMTRAQHSRLPALHVAAVLGKPEFIGGYLQTVAGFVDTIPLEELTSFLELSSAGISLFHQAMTKGTPGVVDACMSAILDSELELQNRIALLDARRKSDGLGAFYVAMSCGEHDTAITFVQGVLQNKSLDDKTKVLLLKCAKPAVDKKASPDKNKTRLLNLAARTARAEAERTGHDRLVNAFDSKIGASALDAESKQKLKTS